MAVITIAREIGSRGDEIAHQVCALLEYDFFTKMLMARVAQEQGLSEPELVDISEDTYQTHSFLAALLRRPADVASAVAHTTTSARASSMSLEESPGVAPLDEETAVAFMSTVLSALQKRGRLVVVGRGAHAILQNQPGVLHVRIVAEREDRVQQVIARTGLTRDGALALMDERDRAAAAYVHRFYGLDWTDPTRYHLTVSSTLLGEQGATEVIVAAARRLDTPPSGPSAALAG
jgi:cytidylate kinase